MTPKQRLACEVGRQINLAKARSRDRQAQVETFDIELLKPSKAPKRLPKPVPVDKNSRLASVLKWSEDNKEEITKRQWELGANGRAQAARYHKERRQTDVAFKLLCSLRSRLRSALKAKGIKKTNTTLKLCSCSLEELKAHLEAQFADWMNWSNHGEWHIDHIRPCASYDLTNEAELKACFHFSNLQPLSAMENFRKNDTYSQFPVSNVNNSALARSSDGILARMRVTRHLWPLCQTKRENVPHNRLQIA